MMVVTRRIDSHTLEILSKKDGEGIGRGTYEVSTDGKTLTAKVSGTDAMGRPFESLIVFDR